MENTALPDEEFQNMKEEAMEIAAAAEAAAAEDSGA